MNYLNYFSHCRCECSLMSKFCVRPHKPRAASEVQYPICALHLPLPDEQLKYTCCAPWAHGLKHLSVTKEVFWSHKRRIKLYFILVYWLKVECENVTPSSLLQLQRCTVRHNTHNKKKILWFFLLYLFLNIILLIFFLLNQPVCVHRTLILIRYLDVLEVLYWGI